MVGMLLAHEAAESVRPLMFWKASEWKDFDPVNLKIKRGQEMTSLMLAAWVNEVEILNVLVQHGVSITAAAGFRQTALPWSLGSPACAQELLRLYKMSDVSVNDVDEDGRTAAMYYAMCGSVDSLELILGMNAGVNFQDCNGNTALHFAAEHNHLGCVQLLHHSGADQELKNTKGDTPDAVSVARKNTECASLFLASSPSTSRQSRRRPS